MFEDISSYTRAIAGERGLLSVSSIYPESHQSATLTRTLSPTFAELLRDGAVSPGKPLILGYDRQGQAQYRSLKDLKTVAIAGLQGSSKTLSTAYIVASSILAHGVHAYIVDPHKQHDKSLYSFIQPLEHTEYVTVVNPFDTPTLINDLHNTLNRRLAGQEANTPGILLVIDELACLAKMACFNVLLAFLQRCTEEARKANITFIGGSHKWTAHHFHGRVDIRGYINSMLIHKTKPSQADLLLKGTHSKHLLKQLQQPGDAILRIHGNTPTLISIPLCTLEDMQTVANMLKAPSKVAITPTSQVAA
jgi:hypothetical protein